MRSSAGQAGAGVSRQLGMGWGQQVLQPGQVFAAGMLGCAPGGGGGLAAPAGKSSSKQYGVGHGGAELHHRPASPSPGAASSPAADTAPPNSTESCACHSLSKCKMCRKFILLY